MFVERTAAFDTSIASSDTFGVAAKTEGIDVETVTEEAKSTGTND